MLSQRELIHAQMEQHYDEGQTAYEAKITKGFTRLRENNYTKPAGEDPVNFRAPVEEKQYIRSILFGGFRKCLYQVQKFDSDPERRFAVLLEDEKDVLKWFKPARDQVRIYYSSDSSYEPDFIVETETEKLMCEPKRASELQDEVVQAKARAAVTWCHNATEHARANGGKPWSYLLIPHDAVTASASLMGLN
jgi:type III restriction enzyme